MYGQEIAILIWVTCGQQHGQVFTVVGLVHPSKHKQGIGSGRQLFIQKSKMAHRSPTVTGKTRSPLSVSTDKLQITWNKLVERRIHLRLLTPTAMVFKKCGIYANGSQKVVCTQFSCHGSNEKTHGLDNFEDRSATTWHFIKAIPPEKFDITAAIKDRSHVLLMCFRNSVMLKMR